MKSWEEIEKDIREVARDLEMAESLLKMMSVRLNSIKKLNLEEETSLIVEGYYEVIKEAVTAIMAIDGKKTISHEALIIYLNKFYKEFDDYEISFVDELRKLRNKINYKGFFVNKNYLERNDLEIRNIIKKLMNIIKEKLK